MHHIFAFARTINLQIESLIKYLLFIIIIFNAYVLIETFLIRDQVDVFQFELSSKKNMVVY